MIFEYFELPPHSTILHGNYDYSFIGLSLVIAVFASFMAFYVVTQAAASLHNVIRKNILLSVGSVALGSGIWAMHFLGMLAFELEVSVTYNISITLLSALPSIFAAWVTLYLMTKKVITRNEIFVGGDLVGLGISSMHYFGMAAMEMSPILRYDPILFVFSIVIAMCLAMLSLWIKFGISATTNPSTLAFKKTLFASAVMAGAICSMHYIGMTATKFVIPSGTAYSIQFSSESLYLAMSVVVVTLVSISLVIGGLLLLKYKEVSQRALDSEKIQRAITDTAIDGILTIDERGLVITANKALEQLVGYKQSELVGQPVSLLIPYERKCIYDDDFFRQKTVPLEQIIGTSREVNIVHKNGHEFPIRVAISYTKIDDKGIFVALISDLRKRREMEDALRESEMKFRSFISNIPGIAYRCLNEKDWPVVFISDAVYDLTGFSADEFVSPNQKKSFSDLYHPDDLDSIYAIEGVDGKFSLEYRLITRSGDIVWVIEHGIHVKDDSGRILYVDGFITDITARRKMEDELKAAKEKAEHAAASRISFLANMSHEIRTPMNSIIGFSELLLKEKMESEHNNHLVTINRSARSLMHLLNDILDSAKLDKGKLELAYKDFVLRDEVDAVVSVFSLEAKNKGISLDINIDEKVAEAYHGVPDRIRQVLINLLGNAIKFTHEGRVSLSIFTDATYVYFRIQDTGIGMTHSQLNRVFEPFTQADASMARKYGGTGLGTTISKQLVELMGGAICVQSDLAQGSVFTVKLPLTVTSVPQRDIANIPIKLPLLQILIVDDVAQNIDLLRQVLVRMGHSVLVATDGQQALDKMRMPGIDLVLMDLQMPILDGFEATRKRRAYEKKHQLTALPIIALTATVLVQDRREAANAGMEGFVQKPIDIPSLILEIARVLNRPNSANNTMPFDTEVKVASLKQAVLIDSQQAISLWGDEHSYLCEIERFVSECKGILELMNIDSVENNSDDIVSLMHRFRGAAGNLYLVALTQKCYEIEMNARQNRANSNAVQELEHELKKIEQWLLHMRGNLSVQDNTTDDENTAHVYLLELLKVLSVSVSKNMLDNNAVKSLKHCSSEKYHVPITAILMEIEDFEFEQAYMRISTLIVTLQTDLKVH